jgi:hypothetical protein
MSQRLFDSRNPTMAAVFCVDCGQKLTGQYCGKCGRDYGATAAAHLSFGNRNSAACRLFGDRQSAAGRLFFDSRSAAGRLFFDSRSAAGSLACVTSALALCAGWNAWKRARGIYVGQEYHRLARWTNDYQPDIPYMN